MYKPNQQHSVSRKEKTHLRAWYTILHFAIKKNFICKYFYLSSIEKVFYFKVLSHSCLLRTRVVLKVTTPIGTILYLCLYSSSNQIPLVLIFVFGHATVATKYLLSYMTVTPWYMYKYLRKLFMFILVFDILC